MCDCLMTFNEQLLPHNVGVEGQTVWTRLEDGREIRTERVRLATYKVAQSRNPKPGVFPTYCPFCGEKYIADTSEAA